MPFIIVDEDDFREGRQRVHADADFDVKMHPFLSGITFLDGGVTPFRPTGAEKRPKFYVIKSPSLVYVLNQFEKCGYRYLGETSDKRGTIRVTLHIDQYPVRQQKTIEQP